MRPLEGPVVGQGPALTRRSLSRALLTAVGAAVLFGGWAAFANREHAVALMGRAALVQAVLSLCSTLGLTLLLEASLQWAHRRVTRWLVGMLLVPLAILGVMFVAHAWMQTPRILAAIAPSLGSGTVFCVAYTLLRERRSFPPA